MQQDGHMGKNKVQEKQTASKRHLVQLQDSSQENQRQR